VSRDVSDGGHIRDCFLIDLALEVTGANAELLRVIAFAVSVRRGCVVALATNGADAVRAGRSVVAIASAGG